MHTFEGPERLNLRGSQPSWPEGLFDIWRDCVLDSQSEVGLEVRAPVEGDWELRVELAALLGVPAGRVVVTAGVRAGASALIGPTDDVAVERPTFGGVVGTIRRQGATVHLAPWSRLTNRLTSHLWVTGQARNPDGRCWPSSFLGVLRDASLKGTKVVVDSVGRWFCSHTVQVEDFAEVGSLHKLAGPGSKLGWVVVPGDWRTSEIIHKAAIATPPLLWQRSWAKFLKAGGLQELQSWRTTDVEDVRNCFLAEVSSANLVEGRGCGEWVLLETEIDGGEAVGRLRGAGVDVNLGIHFFASSRSICVNLAGVSRGLAEEAGKIIRRAVACKPVLL